MSAERKTLTIKNKGVGMWQTHSQVELIEKKLKEDTKAILNNFIHTSALNYNEIYQKNSMAMRYLTRHISDAYEELKKAVKYPNQIREIFEKMCDNVQASLEQEIGAESVKFEEAAHNFLHPKSTLPKVALSAPGCS